MQENFKIEEEILGKKLANEENKAKESSDVKKLTAGTLRKQQGIIKEREDQLKALEKEYNMKLLEFEEVKAELQTENAKVAKYQTQITDLKAKQKTLTGKDFV